MALPVPRQPQPRIHNGGNILGLGTSCSNRVYNFRTQLKPSPLCGPQYRSFRRRPRSYTVTPVTDEWRTRPKSNPNSFKEKRPKGLGTSQQIRYRLRVLSVEEKTTNRWPRLQKEPEAIMTRSFGSRKEILSRFGSWFPCKRRSPSHRYTR